mmetsp:Transcript_17068/g.53834  ORF Transcript_17068/g.53834 Transcript_17068/m.53834 type:complete len:286 (+) Transcript_17068:440-1297(+)
MRPLMASTLALTSGSSAKSRAPASMCSTPSSVGSKPYFGMTLACTPITSCWCSRSSSVGSPAWRSSHSRSCAWKPGALNLSYSSFCRAKARSLSRGTVMSSMSSSTGAPLKVSLSTGRCCCSNSSPDCCRLRRNSCCCRYCCQCSSCCCCCQTSSCNAAILDRTSLNDDGDDGATARRLMVWMLRFTSGSSLKVLAARSISATPVRLPSKPYFGMMLVCTSIASCWCSLLKAADPLAYLRSHLRSRSWKASALKASSSSCCSPNKRSLVRGTGTSSMSISHGTLV